MRLPQVPGSKLKHGISDMSTSIGGSKFTVPASLGLSELSGPGASMSLEEAVGLSQLLDSAFELPKDFDTVGGLCDDALAISSPETILRDVKKYVRERNPHLEEVDDALLERRRKEERSDPGCLIILPDNRVRSVGDQLNRRIRATLLGEDIPETPIAPPPKRVEEQKKDGFKRIRNPWYIDSKHWYSADAMRSADDDQDVNPYESLAKANATTDEASTEVKELIENSDDKEGGRPRRLTEHDKETLPIVDSYRRFVIRDAGARLPHFLR